MSAESMSNHDHWVSDAQLLKDAFSDLENEAKRVLKKVSTPRNAMDVVNNASQFQAVAKQMVKIADRIESLSRAVLELQTKVNDL